MLKLCKANGCSFPVWSHGYCQRHGYLRTDDKKPKPMDKTKKPTGEAALFKAIWLSTPTRERVSFISGVDLNKYENTKYFYSLFAHVLPKSHYGKFRILRKNLALLSPEEHTLYDQGTEEEREEYTEIMKSQGIEVDWQKLYNLADELRERYRQNDTTI